MTIQVPLSSLTQSPVPPYYVVIFTSQRTAENNGYAHMAGRLLELAAQHPGFMGLECARRPDGFGITLYYWKTAEAVTAWRASLKEYLNQGNRQNAWYEHYELRVAKVEQLYSL